MAESDSILQLGIEAARDGNREEARNLFRLLTRQDPSNAQAWLWLAGVAENRDERQAALERVVELDPNNEMAVKGLQALGVRPTARLREDQPTTQTPPPIMPVDDLDTTPPPITPSEPDRSRYDIDDDDPYSQFDTLSDAMAESPTAVRRSEPLPGEGDPFDDLSDDANNDPARRSRRQYERERAGTSRSTRRIYDEDEGTVPARSGVSPLLLGAVILVLLLVLGWVIWSLLFGDQDVANTTTPTTASAIASEGTTTGAIGVDGTSAPTDGTTAPTDATAVPGGVATDPTGAITDTAGLEATAAPAEQPPAEQPPAAQPPADDLANAQPAIVAAGTALSSNGWQYDFNQPNYAVQINGPIGSLQPQGRFVAVLVFLANNTGTAQPIPADFFVLKDAEGRVYQSLPAASSAYVVRGVNADLSQEDAIPADGFIRSVPIVFDVQPGATNLTLFSRSNPAQGWVVLGSVQ